MSHPLAPLLPELALGTLPEAEAETVRAALASSPELRAELAELEEALSLVAAALPPPALDPSRRDILLEAAHDQTRFQRFVEPLMDMFDAGRAEVQRALGWLADTRRWKPGPMPGIALLYCAPGPKAAGFEVGFIRFAAGLQFPRHRHLGKNTELVMEGEFLDQDTGVVHTSGDLIVKEEGSIHSFKVSDDEPCLLGVRFPGLEVLP